METNRKTAKGVQARSGQGSVVLEGYYPFPDESTVDIGQHTLNQRVFKRYSKRHFLEDLSVIKVHRVIRNFMQIIEVYGMVNLSEEGYRPFFVTSLNVQKVESLQHQATCY
jgi:hypothetical protein